MNYRILTDGEKFRVQKKFLIFWMYLRQVYQYDMSVILEFNKINDAHEAIKDDIRKNKVKKCKWKVIK